MSLDADGYPISEGIRLDDHELLSELFTNIKFNENYTFESEIDGQRVFIEPFQSCMVAQQVGRDQIDGHSTFYIEHPGSIREEFDPNQLRLDLHDRFHGVTKRNIPFVMSHKAQFEFFNIVDGYDDDSIEIDSKKIQTPDLYTTDLQVDEAQTWTQKYQDMEDAPPWELNCAHPSFEKVVPSLKLMRSKIVNLGCGSGNDAAFFAKNGHLVTGVDFSPRAIKNARSKYSNISGLQFLEEDLFKLPPDLNNSFDLVVEHTLFVAIDPHRRKELVKTWKKLLAPKGHLLAIFFVMPRYQGPPFGTSEWEIQNLLEKNNFQTLLWSRDIETPERRSGKELLVYAQLMD